MAEIITTPLGTGSLGYGEPWRTEQQQDVAFRLRYLPTDTIRTQFIVKGFTVYDLVNILSVKLLNVNTGVVSTVPWSVVHTESDTTCFINASVAGLVAGCYKLQIVAYGAIWEQWTFEVCDKLPGTKLVEWWNIKNDFEVAFNPGVLFSFRIDAEFFPQDDKHPVQANTFRDQSYRLHQLSAKPYKTETLTFGGRLGAPVWVGEKMNQIFSCTNVMIDGIEYVRSEGAEVEMQVFDNMYPLYLFKLAVEKADIEKHVRVIGTGGYSDGYSNGYRG